MQKLIYFREKKYKMGRTVITKKHFMIYSQSQEFMESFTTNAKYWQIEKDNKCNFDSFYMLKFVYQGSYTGSYSSEHWVKSETWNHNICKMIETDMNNYLSLSYDSVTELHNIIKEYEYYCSENELELEICEKYCLVDEDGRAVITIRYIDNNRDCRIFRYDIMELESANERSYIFEFPRNRSTPIIRCNNIPFTFEKIDKVNRYSINYVLDLNHSDTVKLISESGYEISKLCAILALDERHLLDEESTQKLNDINKSLNDLYSLLRKH